MRGNKTYTEGMRFLAAFLIASSSASASAAPGDLSSFLKACGWGVVVGAGIGAVSLAFENKPSDHTSNIARGASLGLYGGIIYGLVQANPPPERRTETFGWVTPVVHEGRVDGVTLHSVALTF